MKKYTDYYESKFDQGKPRMDLVPSRPLLLVGSVLGFGAKKYGENSWRSVPDGNSRYYAAAMRHLLAFNTGESVDPDSGLPHLAHAITNLMFLLELSEGEYTNEI